MFIKLRRIARRRSRRQRPGTPFRAPGVDQQRALQVVVHLRPHRLWRGGPVVHRQWVGEFLHPAVYVGLLPMASVSRVSGISASAVRSRASTGFWSFVPAAGRDSAFPKPTAWRLQYPSQPSAARDAEPPAPRDVLRALPADARRLGERLLGTFQRLVQRLPIRVGGDVRARALLAALALEGVVAAELLAKRGEPDIAARGLGNAHTSPAPVEVMSEMDRERKS